MNQKDYIRLSLELHLFFDRIMKEHSLFLEAAFMEKDNELKKIADNFQRTFSEILERVVTLANGNINNVLIQSNEFVTNHTLEAENKTSNLSGVNIDTNITLKEMNLRSGQINLNEQLFNDISSINRETLPIIENLIQFKNDILNQVLSCKIYTTNYSLLITHIINEAKMYHKLLTKLENKEPLTEHYIYEQEVFWNNIMKEHAEFIRGLLDPSEEELILTAERFSNNYESILKNYTNNLSYLTNYSLKETIDFQKFKVAGEEGILKCKIKSIIIPLLADHVVREANHFIRILNNFNQRYY